MQDGVCRSRNRSEKSTHGVMLAMHAPSPVVPSSTSKLGARLRKGQPLGRLLPGRS